MALDQIRADTDAVDAHAVGGMGDHVAERLERAVGLVLQVERIHRKAQHAAAIGQSLQQVVGLVPKRGLPGLGVGVGDGDRPL